MPTVRVNENTHKSLISISKNTQETFQDIIAEAVEDYRRKKFLQEANKAFSILKENEREWQVDMEERKEWDRVIGDGQAEENK